MKKFTNSNFQYLPDFFGYNVRKVQFVYTYYLNLTSYAKFPRTFAELSSKSHDRSNPGVGAGVGSELSEGAGEVVGAEVVGASVGSELGRGEGCLLHESPRGN